MPAPPPWMINPQGQTANRPPAYPSFLPTDPNAMATGLTPQHMQQIGGMQPAAPQPAPGMGMGGPSTGYQQIMDFFKQLGGGQYNFGGGGGMGGGGGFGGGMGGGQSLQQMSPNDRRNAFMLGLPPMPNIPQPTPGAGGQVAPGDVAAYNAARTQASEQRTDLAKQMMSQRRRGRLSPGGRSGGGGGR